MALVTSAQHAWLRRHAHSFWTPTSDDHSCEAPCAELLTSFLSGMLAGVPLSQPWNEFWGEMQPPDHPARRVPSNIERYAGNYVNIIFGGALFMTCLHHPILVGVICFAQAIALLAPPEFFDVSVLRLRRYGGGYMPVGGAWLRFRFTLTANLALWLLLLLAPARFGALIGVLLVLTHAFLRKRPWIEIAKERLNVKKDM